jgi:hypothetical protein
MVRVPLLLTERPKDRLQTFRAPADYPCRSSVAPHPGRVNWAQRSNECLTACLKTLQGGGQAAQKPQLATFGSA